MKGAPFLIEGTGGLARALVGSLVQAGQRTILASRDAARARDRATGWGCEAWQGPVVGGTLLLAVPDRALEEASARVLARGDRPQAALHLAGSQGPERLDTLAKAGAEVGVLHPLGSFPPGAPRVPAKLVWTACGSGEALEVADGLIQAFGGSFMALHPGQGARTRYHAAASLVAGGLAMLLEAGEALAVDQVGDPAALRRGLIGLARTVLENAGEQGPRGALTGPAARGDLAVVQQHLAVMDEGTRALYEALVEQIRAGVESPE